MFECSRYLKILKEYSVLTNNLSNYSQSLTYMDFSSADSDICELKIFFLNPRKFQKWKFEVCVHHMHHKIHASKAMCASIPWICLCHSRDDIMPTATARFDKAKKKKQQLSTTMLLMMKSTTLSVSLSLTRLWLVMHSLSCFCYLCCVLMFTIWLSKCLLKSKMVKVLKAVIKNLGRFVKC